jgi:transcriptional regulator with XRE-family HTH domain
MSEPDWARLPAAAQAASAGQYGVLLRLARTAAGLTLEDAGRKAGYSASTISRMETGKRPLTNVTVLRHLAAAFGIPPGLFGLAAGAPVLPAEADAGNLPSGPGPERQGGDDPVRRRDLLASIGGSIAAMAAAPVLPAAPGDPAAELITKLEQVLLARRRAPAASPAALRRGLAAARFNFQAGRYRALCGALPDLVAAAGSNSADPTVSAELYNMAVHVCIKLKATGLDWLAADRALAAADLAADPAVTASITRNVVTLLRGAGRYRTAQDLALSAAAELPLTGPASTAGHLSLYGILLCNAGYAAAQEGDRDRCTELLDEADRAATVLGSDRNEHWTAFGPTEVRLHRISSAWRLGDSGTAIEHARQIRSGTITLPERQARYWTDVARAFDQWGKPAACYTALRAAEAAAPEETRAQPKVRALTTRLLSAPTTPAMSGLRDFAVRTGAA